MFKNPWFMLVIGVIVGLVVGYSLAEMQSVPPARTMQAPQQQGAAAGLPDGHPPLPASGGEAPGMAAAATQQQAAELMQLLSQSPEDTGLMVALGNVYFDGARWQDARLWYERALEKDRRDPNVLTDLAVVYRNLDRPQQSLELLDEALALEPDHWQAVYNKVVVLHFDLHEHDAAEQALSRLEGIKSRNAAVPDLSQLAAEVRGG
jgi:tetratricopeptide (TPR) repeat protein